MREKLPLAIKPAVSKLFLLFSFLLFSQILLAQSVSGTVTDQSGKGLQGITVTVKGTSRATSTNDAGKFSIEAGSNAVLVFTSVGYLSQELPVNGQSSLNVSLAPTSQNMDEVVVTALGISRKSRGLGYAATNVKPEELTVNRSANPINAPGSPQIISPSIAKDAVVPPKVGSVQREM